MQATTADITSSEFRKTKHIGSQDSINWVSTAIICVPPVLVLCAALAGVAAQANTIALGIVFWALSGFSITAGYHRLYSHRAYDAHTSVQLFFAFFGAGAFEGSIKWWGRNHRIHHRHIDTDKDPYNATRGFYYSHLGWMIRKQDPATLGRADVSDFNRMPVVVMQHNFYFPIAMAAGIVLPTLIAGFGWGDWYGGYFYAALAKMIVVHHSTFFINSLAHSPMFGAHQDFSNQNTSHDSVLCAVLTYGEGYHNFHHEFPQDYRNGIRWYHYDPTKWLIRSLSFFGLATGLQRFPQTVIDNNFAIIKRKVHLTKLQKIEARLTTLERMNVPMPAWTMAHVLDLVSQGRKLTVIQGYVLDLETIIDIGQSATHKGNKVNWYHSHPGGRPMLDAYVGKDATEAFTGGVYRHSTAASNFVHQLKVATLIS